MKKTVEEQSSPDQILLLVLAIILCVTALWAVGCGSPSTPSTTTTSISGSTSGAIGATITINANGLSDSTPRIKIGERVRFTNADSKTHQILTTPHLIHTDCPGLNSISSLAPGQSGTSDPLGTSRGCGFHDHLDPDNNAFRGQVLVGLGSNDPIPADPSYLHGR